MNCCLIIRDCLIKYYDDSQQLIYQKEKEINTEQEL